MKEKSLLLFFICCIYSILGQELVDTVGQLKMELQNEVVDTTKVNLKIKIADHYLKKNIDSSGYYYSEALDLAVKIDSDPHKAKVYFKIGKFYAKQNDYEKAIHNLLEAAYLYDTLKNKKRSASAYNYIGYYYLDLYAEDKAIEYYLKSLGMYRSIGDEDGMGINYIDIGNLYYDQENYEYAQRYFLDALTIYEKLEDNLGIATCFTNLGNATADDGHVELGLEYYSRSIEINEKADYQYGIALNYNNMGDCYLELNQYQEAEAYFLKSLEITQTLEDEDLISIIYLNLADTYLKLKKYDQAIINANKSLEICEKTGGLDIEVDNFMFLSTAYENLGNTPKALHYLKQHKKIKDSLIDIDKAKKVQLFNALNELEKTHFTIDDLSMKNEITQLNYENEKKLTYGLIIGLVIFAFLIILLIIQRTAKRKAYNLLAYKNQQVKSMNDEIQKQRDFLNQMNTTKDKFFSIIAHDLKNPFNSIKGFTELMIENSDEYTEEKKLKFLKIIKSSTNRVSDLLNNLLIWANSQSGSLDFKPQKISIKTAVSNTISLLEVQAIKKDIKIEDGVAGNIFVRADENMLDTILRNLISNAIKFTEPGGNIVVLSLVEDDFVKITIKDNGIGINPSEIDNLFSIDVKISNVGTANEKGSGLGLILCKDFVDKQGGNLTVQSELTKGSEFSFTLPVWKKA